MYIMCIVCLGYLSFFPTSAIASVLCTCISMYSYMHVVRLHCMEWVWSQTSCLRDATLYSRFTKRHLERVGVAGLSLDSTSQWTQKEEPS